MAALSPVFCFVWVHWTGFARYLNKAGYWYLSVADEGDSLTLEGPICPEVFLSDPSFSFSSVALAGPFPEELKRPVVDLSKDLLGRSMPVVIHPASDDAGEFFNDLESRHGHVAAQIGDLR